MTTWTDNMEVPHLDQNVAQPEIPENVAKDIFDDIFAGKHTTDLTVDADHIYVYIPDPKLAQPWHNFVQEFTSSVITGTITVTFPDNNRPYLIINSTSYTLNFKITAQATSVALAAGENMYAYSHGEGNDLEKLDFASSTTTLVALTDVDPYDNGKVLRSLAAGTEWYDIATDLAAKLAHTGGTATTTTLAGTTTNSGTIDGGILLDSELKDFSYASQTVTSGATPAFDLSNGNIVKYTNTETATITFTTSQTNTSFKLLLTNGAAFTLTWPTIAWGTAGIPTFQSAGADLVEFTKIDSIWYGQAIALNVG